MCLFFVVYFFLLHSKRKKKNNYDQVDSVIIVNVSFINVKPHMMSNIGAYEILKKVCNNQIEREPNVRQIRVTS